MGYIILSRFSRPKLIQYADHRGQHIVGYGDDARSPTRSVAGRVYDHILPPPNTDPVLLARRLALATQATCFYSARRHGELQRHALGRGPAHPIRIIATVFHHTPPQRTLEYEQQP